MSKRSRIVVSVWAAAAALGLPVAEAADVPGAKPGDEAMTCEQLATELQPYMQQMVPNLQALGTAQQQLYAQGRQQMEVRKREHEALTPLATAGALDPTGISKRAYQAAVTAQAAKEARENEAMANSAPAQEAKARETALAAQGQQMQGNARLQRLMQLGQQKGCTRK